MAGRDARKLEEVKSKLAQINPACKVCTGMAIIQWCDLCKPYHQSSMQLPYSLVCMAVLMVSYLLNARVSRDCHRPCHCAQGSLARSSPCAQRHVNACLCPMQDVPILTADARDASAVGGVLKQTSVVLAMAGPFSKWVLLALHDQQCTDRSSL